MAVQPPGRHEGLASLALPVPLADELRREACEPGDLADRAHLAAEPGLDRRAPRPGDPVGSQEPAELIPVDAEGLRGRLLSMARRPKAAELGLYGIGHGYSTRQQRCFPGPACFTLNFRPVRRPNCAADVRTD